MQAHKSEEWRCTACGSMGEILYRNMRDHLFGVGGVWSLIKCKNCGLVWLYPRPGSEEIPSFYQAYHTHQEVERYSRIMIKSAILTPSILMGYGNIRLGLRDKVWRRIFSFIGPLREAGKRSVMWLRARPGGSLLDIGCGTGNFLSRMKKYGWNVSGVENDPKAVQYAREKYSLKNVYLGSLKDVQFPDAIFDAITMSHVIEHLLDPVDTLENCLRILKPGGLLVITTPNAESLGVMYFKKMWRGWEPPRHIYIYSSRSLGMILQKTGYQLVMNKTPSSAAYPIWMNSILLRGKVLSKNGMMPTPSTGQKFMSILVACIEDVVSRFGLKRSEELVIVAQRPF